MPEIRGIEKLFSLVAKKRFGRYREFGTSQFAFTNFGDEDVCLGKAFFAYAFFGDTIFGDGLILSGIYRTDQVTGKTKFYREPYYITRNPRSDLQQAHRQKYGQAVEAWRGLTPPEKAVYNKRAKGKPYTGWNLFYKEYLLSD